jgi:hypothetical protein
LTAMRIDARRISRRYQGGEPRFSFRKSTGCSSPPAAIRANRRPFGYFALRRDHPSLFFPAMLHTDSIITAAGLPRMSFQAGLLDVAAYFAIVRLLGPCSVGAVYKKHQKDGKGSHDDLLSRCDFLVRNPRTLARLFRCFHEPHLVPARHVQRFRDVLSAIKVPGSNDGQNLTFVSVAENASRLVTSVTVTIGSAV